MKYQTTNTQAKSRTVLFAAMIIMVCGIGGLSSAQTWNCGPKGKPDAIKATLVSGTLKISGNGPMKDDNHPWNRYAGAGDSITNVIIEEGVTSIGEDAFAYLKALNSITIPNSVTSIGKYAFAKCASLTSIAIPNSVKSIGENAFEECTSLKSVTIPNSVAYIGQGAFIKCTSLTSVTIPGSVISIGTHAFEGLSIHVDKDNPSYSSVDGVFFNKAQDTLIQYPPAKQSSSYTIPNSVRVIGEYAFAGCDGLTSITIPGNVKSIGKMAFAFCKNLKFVTISNGVKSIGENAFVECTALTSVTIPGSVTSIAFQVFAYCTGLTSITITEGVTSIEHGAFYRCTGLASITIPRSVTSIESGVFASCVRLASINVHEKNPSYSSVDGVLFNKAMNTLVGYPIAKQGSSYTIPNSVVTIKEYAFEDCINLRSITIPNSVIEIGTGAFRGCGKLKSVIISRNVEVVGEYALSDCPLSSVTSLNPVPPAIKDGDALFNVIPWGATLYVPEAGIKAYRQAPGWKKFDSYNIRPMKD